MEIKAKLAVNDRVVTVERDFGTDLDSLVKLVGAEVVYSRAKQSLVIDVQAKVRSAIKKGLFDQKAFVSDEDIQKAITEWTPGIATTVRKTAKEKAQDAISKLSPEEKKALLKELRAG